jgi:BirA family biotin operon repressor/biotin-[acetyl-CoA-carboxylase] ligase
MKKNDFVKKTVEFSKKYPFSFVKQLLVFDELESTNSTAKEAGRTGVQEGTVVLAKTQKKGRGRFDRIWQSPEGGVYLSMILKPKTPIEKTSLLPFVAALAVAQTINSYGLHATIKWPNDVLVQGKKIAGILLESETEGQTVSYVVVGIGINLNIDLSTLPSEIQAQSTAMIKEIGETIEYYQFLTTFFTQFDHYYQLFSTNQYEQIVKEWKNHSDTLGKQVRILTSTETLQGTAADIDSSGFLILKKKNGETKKITSGDCLYLNELDHT